MDEHKLELCALRTALEKAHAVLSDCDTLLLVPSVRQAMGGYVLDRAMRDIERLASLVNEALEKAP